MRKSLWLKLMSLFTLVIIAGVIATIVAINVSVSTQFERFVRSGDLLQAQELAGVLANTYARQGSWVGVETVLSPETQAMMGPGMMNETQMGGITTAEMIEMMRGSGMGGDRVVLVDTQGIVVADTTGSTLGEHHPSDHLSVGQAVVVEGQRVGTVLVGSMIEPALNPLDADFLHSVNLAVLWAALATGMLALGLGSLLFFQITRPVREVTAAAEALAAGDLNQRAQVRSQDEVGRLAVAFNRMADALAQQEILRRNMVNDIAHELRTPLTLMQGNLEAMLDGYYELSPGNIASLHQDTLMMTRLVNDLRVLSLAEAGQLSLELGAVDMRELIERVCENFRARAAGKGITLTWDVSPHLPFIQSDEQRLAQVLSNLLSNALQHTAAEGTIHIHCAVAEDQEVDRAGTKSWVQVSVRDSGAGISAADLPYVFERFYRTDKSRTRASGGTGLGLAIARQLVEAQGGRIWAESQGVGRGTVFHFVLPATIST